MWHSTILVVMTKRKRKKEKKQPGRCWHSETRTLVLCVYTPATVDLYLLFVSRCLYTCWEYQRMMGCRVSSFTAGSLYNMCTYFSSLFWKKKGEKKICSVLLWDIGKVTERKLAYRVLYSENVYQNLGLQRLTCRGIWTHLIRRVLSVWSAIYSI